MVAEATEVVVEATAEEEDTAEEEEALEVDSVSRASLSFPPPCYGVFKHI